MEVILGKLITRGAVVLLGKVKDDGCLLEAADGFLGEEVASEDEDGCGVTVE